MPERVKWISAERECCKSGSYHAASPCDDRDGPGVLARTGGAVCVSAIPAFSGAERA